MRKLNADGLKKYNHSSTVTDDEIYFFRKPINPAKVSHFQIYMKLYYYYFFYVIPFFFIRIYWQIY